MISGTIVEVRDTDNVLTGYEVAVKFNDVLISTWYYGPNEGVTQAYVDSMLAGKLSGMFN